MNCRNAIYLMHDILDKDINEYNNQELQKHMKTCLNCDDHFAQLKLTDGLLKQVAYKQTAPDYLGKVISQLPKTDKVHGMKRWFRSHPGLTAASIFLMFFAISLFSYTVPNSDFKIVSEEYNALVINGKEVIVPEGESLTGDLVVENGNLQIEGEVKGNVTVVNGKLLMANASNVNGKTKQIDQLFEWIWYQGKIVWANLTN